MTLTELELIEHLDFDLVCEKVGGCDQNAEWSFCGETACCKQLMNRVYCQQHHDFFVSTVPPGGWACNLCGFVNMVSRHWESFTTYEWSRL